MDIGRLTIRTHGPYLLMNCIKSGLKSIDNFAKLLQTGFKQKEYRRKKKWKSSQSSTPKQTGMTR